MLFSKIYACGCLLTFLFYFAGTRNYGSSLLRFWGGYRKNDKNVSVVFFFWSFFPFGLLLFPFCSFSLLLCKKNNRQDTWFFFSFFFFAFVPFFFSLLSILYIVLFFIYMDIKSWLRTVLKHVSYIRFIAYYTTIFFIYSRSFLVPRPWPNISRCGCSSSNVLIFEAKDGYL